MSNGDLKDQVKVSLLNALIVLGVAVTGLWIIIQEGPFELKTEATSSYNELRTRMNEDEQENIRIQKQTADQLEATGKRDADQMQAVANTVQSIQDNQQNMNDNLIQLQQHMLDMQGQPFTPVRPSRHGKAPQ